MAKATRRTIREVPARTHPEIAGPPRARRPLDVGRLERALRKAVKGEVRFDAGSLGLYAQDASNFRQVPIGVVVPRTLDDVVAVHKVCHRFGAPVLNRGGGTSLSGETVNEAVVIDHSKYLTAIGDIDVGAPCGRPTSGPAHPTRRSVMPCDEGRHRRVSAQLAPRAASPATNHRL